METLTSIADSSLSATSSSALACDACVKDPSGPEVVSVSDTEDRVGGSKSFTINSFICGVLEVAIATRYGFVGQTCTSDGVNATHALECGARFCLPIKVNVGDSGLGTA